MVAKGNVDKHRYSYSGGVKAVESEKWGRDTARSRYGTLDQGMKAKDTHGPQHPENQHGPKYENRTPNDWRRGAGESAEGKPNFQPGYKGKS